MSVLIEAQHGSEADWWHCTMDSRCCDPDTVSDSGPILMDVGLSISDKGNGKISIRINPWDYSIPFNSLLFDNCMVL